MKKEDTIIRITLISLFIGALSPILQARCFTWTGLRYISISLLVMFILLIAYILKLIINDK